MIVAVALFVASLTLFKSASSRAPAATPTPANTRPDILFVTIDTLRADAVGAYGQQGNPTPWIDRLAAAGVRFTHADAQTPLTLPSHATLLSGRYPFAHGVRDNAGFRFPADVDTLATLLRSRGYRTGAFVSAFPLDARFGLARGFDIYDDRLSESPRPAFLEQERAGAATVARARAWLDAPHDRPTFCWVHLYEPHFPYTPPEPYASRFADNAYEGEVAAADAALAPLLQPIVENGATTRPIVVLTADHGESLGEHGESTHGIFAYEATLHVPLVVYAPGRLDPGVRDDVIRQIDVAPTILDLAGVPLPQEIDGRSARTPHTDTPTSYFEALSGALNRGWAPLRGVRRGTLKFIELPIPELYDLAADPGERRNLAEARTADVAALRSLLQSFPTTPAARRAERADTASRLQALGYIGGAAAPRSHYTAADDPKQLIGIDRDLQNVVSAYTAGDTSRALSEARRIAEAHAAMPLAWLELAQLQRETGDLPSAIASFKRAHVLAPDNPQIASMLGASLTQHGDTREAVAILTPLTSSDDADVEVIRTLALASARAGTFDRAIALLERARTFDSADPQLLVDEGTVQLMANRREPARAAFQAALTRDPAFPRAHSSLAAMALDDGRTADAAAHWKEAAAGDPSEFGRIFALAVANANAGRAPQARAALEFFVQSAPPSSYAGQIAQARAWLDHPR
jgi:arylsulfatase A-like enzyme/Tfp pilus assembly protein PilF